MDLEPGQLAMTDPRMPCKIYLYMKNHGNFKIPIHVVANVPVFMEDNGNWTNYVMDVCHKKHVDCLGKFGIHPYSFAIRKILRVPIYRP